ncbi:MAG TPA: choice-of-anchor V domain-containing protein [Blastocatellia bacterium]|nr:choice-of-anchor V domain-containing protein [Blastocatellia bacterium]
MLMFKLKSKRKIQAVAMVLLITAIAYASATGPEARYTGAPGDIGTCYNCHDAVTSGINSGSGSVQINGLPSVYEPGEQYTFTVVTQQGGKQRYGFQLTAIDSNGDRAGTLAPDGSDSQVNPLTGTGDRQYIQHSQTGTVANGQSSHTWRVRWTAPSTDVGTVRFFAAGNAANGDGTNQGQDNIYTTSALSESPTTVVTLQLETQPGGETLAAGSRYLIDWTVTNPSNVDSYEIRYSTDDGATFPITNRIVTITDPAVTSHEWTVPNASTTQARLRVQVATKAGAAIEVKSGRFTITGDGTSLIPRIVNAEVIGKHLYVEGVNLKTGAKVEMDGETLKTAFETATRLKCKKAGKKIDRGEEVELVVKFPDNTRTDIFVWVRPNN